MRQPLKSDINSKNKLKQLLPLLISTFFPLLTHGNMAIKFIHSNFLYASESWAQKKDDFENLTGHESSMTKRMLDFTVEVKVSKLKIYSKLCIEGTIITVLNVKIRHVWCYLKLKYKFLKTGHDSSNISNTY